MIRYFLFVIAGLLIAGCAKEPRETAAVTITETEAVQDTLQTFNYDGLEIFLAERTSEYQVINFWATWCKPCVDEMPYFKQLHDQISAEGGEVILVSLDFPNQVESKLKPYIEREELKPTVVLLDDPKANVWIDKVSPEWSGSIPATLIRKNEQSAFHEGKYASYEMLLEQVNSLIKS